VPKLKDAPQSSLTLFAKSLRSAAVAAETLLSDQAVDLNRKIRVAHLIALARYLGREYEMVMALEHAQPDISTVEARGALFRHFAPESLENDVP